MSKIITAVNVMVSNPDKITNVIPCTAVTSSESFFLYDAKHKWSITKSNDSDAYFLHYYPTSSLSLEELAAMDTFDWGEYAAIITYSSNELGTKEAKDSLRELYTIVQEKLFGMDKVLDDIIGSDDFIF